MVVKLIQETFVLNVESSGGFFLKKYVLTRNWLFYSAVDGGKFCFFLTVYLRVLGLW